MRDPLLVPQDRQRPDQSVRVDTAGLEHLRSNPRMATFLDIRRHQAESERVFGADLDDARATTPQRLSMDAAPDCRPAAKTEALKGRGQRVGKPLP